MRTSTLCLLIFLALAYGQPTCNEDCRKQENLKYEEDDYYKSAYKCIKKRDLECLKQEISIIIKKDAKTFPTCCLSTILYDTDQDEENDENVTLLFTDVSKSKQDKANVTEHVLWPSSRGAKSVEAANDIHQIRLCDTQVAKARGERDFKEDGKSICLEPFNSAIEDCKVLTTYTTETFEVPDNQKGDVARMLFYMVFKYTELNLSLEDVTNGSTQLGWKSDLIKWSLEDEVDDFEEDRNSKIYSYQLNRNPFIDHPEWIKYIYVDQAIPPQPGLTTAGIILIVVVGVLHIISLLLCFLQSFRSKEKADALLASD